MAVVSSDTVILEGVLQKRRASKLSVLSVNVWLLLGRRSSTT